MAGQDERVPNHRAVKLPAESNHYCQLNHFRLTWRQNGDLSTPLPVRKERFFPPTHWHDEHVKMPPDGYAKRVVLLPLQ